MRQITIVLLVLVLFLFVQSILASEWQRGVIAGYGSAKYAVDGEIKIQVEGLKKKIVGLKTKGEGKLVVKITGFADLSGKANDDLSLKRAQAIASELSDLKADFSQVEISTVPAGDSANIRQVVVEYVFVPVSVNRVEAKKPVELIVLIIFGTLIFIFVSMSAWFILRKREKTKGKETVSGKYIEVGEYLVPIEFRGNLYYSPFRSGSGAEIFREKAGAIITSIIGCMKKPEFAGQKEELIRKGVIKKKEG